MTLTDILTKDRERTIQHLRDEIARLRALIIMGQDYDKSIVRDVARLYEQLDELGAGVCPQAEPPA